MKLLASSSFIVFALSTLFALLRWGKKHISLKAKEEVYEEMQEHFIVSMATNHLPHLQHNDEIIFDIIRKIAVSLGVEVEERLPEPPPIDFLPAEAIKTFRAQKGK